MAFHVALHLLTSSIQFDTVEGKESDDSRNDNLPYPSQLPSTPKQFNLANQEEYDFVEQPPKDFFCPVTFDLLLEPCQTTCCGNHLSERASARLKSENKPCPVCKEPQLATMPDKYHQRKVRAVQVRCPHSPNGCEWVGEVGGLEQHKQTCLKHS